MSEHLDVVVIGAGISGISAAWHLQRHCPSKSYAVLERRPDLGGTWDLFRYPGIRSDSDMFTFAFRFKPWTADTTIADGATIKDYLQETVGEHGIDEHIRYGHRLLAADWSDTDAAWRLTIERDGETTEISCGFLVACSGYYDYDEAYAPEFPGADDFTGPIIHPQHWPEDLDYTGKKIAVIGSGATAVTLVPALVESGAGHVTMVQRSPGYIGLLPSVDPVASRLNRMLPARIAAALNRWGYIVGQIGIYQVSRRFPNVMRKTLMAMARRRLPEGFDVAKHFGPSYQPWDQRLCLAPDGDLFATISAGRADVVTDEIESFTPSGIRLSSGEELAADMIVTATGLNLRLFGGAEISRNGVRVNPRDTVAYQSMMLSGVPNLAFTVGYSNASWTLKADLVPVVPVRTSRCWASSTTTATPPWACRPTSPVPAVTAATAAAGMSPATAAPAVTAAATSSRPAPTAVTAVAAVTAVPVSARAASAVTAVTAATAATAATSAGAIRAAVLRRRSATANPARRAPLTTCTAATAATAVTAGSATRPTASVVTAVKAVSCSRRTCPPDRVLSASTMASPTVAPAPSGAPARSTAPRARPAPRRNLQHNRESPTRLRVWGFPDLRARRYRYPVTRRRITQRTVD